MKLEVKPKPMTLPMMCYCLMCGTKDGGNADCKFCSGRRPEEPLHLAVDRASYTFTLQCNKCGRIFSLPAPGMPLPMCSCPGSRSAPLKEK